MLQGSRRRPRPQLATAIDTCGVATGPSDRLIQGNGGPGERGWRIALLALLLGFGLALDPLASARAVVGGATAVPKEGCAAVPGFISLDGRQYLEIRRTPAAQRLEDYVRRGNARLQQLAEDRSVAPAQLVVQEEPPFSLVGILEKDGRFKPELAVGDRAAACFGLTRQQLALRYRDGMRRAITNYRGSHTLASWLRGTALAALVLGVYILWLRLQGGLNRRLRRQFAESPRFVMQGLDRLGLSGFVEADHVRQLMQLLRQLVHWSLVLVLVISYLLIPLLLGFFPPTEGIAAGLRGQIKAVVLGSLNQMVQTIPSLFSIGVIMVITVLVIRANRAWFRAIENGRIRLPGFYQEWALPTSRLVTILFSLVGLAAAFPYIPGSGSKVFQGTGLVLGALAALNDFHISHELTAYVRQPDTYRETLSEVLAALQDQFAAADVEILSPGYHAIRNGNASTVSKRRSPEERGQTS